LAADRGRLAWFGTHQCTPVSGGLAEVAVKNGTGDPVGLGDDAHALALRLPGTGHGEHVLIDDGRPSTCTPLRLGCVESCAGALLDEAALKLRHGSDHLKHETAVSCTRGDVGQRTCEHLEPDAPLSKGVDHGHKVDEGPGEPVELPHAQGVAGSGIVQYGRELWPVGVLSAGFVLEDAG